MSVVNVWPSLELQQNLVTYLTNRSHEGNVSSARNISIWLGTSYLTPLIGAVLADGYWGRYWTIAVFSAVYFIGMCTLTLSASLPALKPSECLGSVCPSATPAQYAVSYSGLYVIALGIGGIKSCVPSFGAGKFDNTDPKERVKKGSFFNWYYFSINLGAIVSCSIVVWIQDNAGWGLGFGIPTLFMVLSVDFLHQIPQYFLLGAAEVFAFVGLLQFFYDQSPDAMKTLGTALSPLYFALGNYLSSFILTMVTYFTTQGGKLGWIPDNLNKGHLDYFFLLLAGLSFLNMLAYVVAAAEEDFLRFFRHLL
ncbi:protein NRT1/ PTR FAMILY 8.3-like [Glycine soja]|uniref:protein NRT1/ PTR FAMILY 8.3-like n=1 Tax=Glycine soja TaxID=3848 RepID=UPI00103B397A|nr:protein NRT1/ PTR FAMILY 8.3-like [Glycine soja]